MGCLTPHYKLCIVLEVFEIFRGFLTPGQRGWHRVLFQDLLLAVCSFPNRLDSCLVCKLLFLVCSLSVTSYLCILIYFINIVLTIHVRDLKTFNIASIIYDVLVARVCCLYYTGVIV